MSLFQLPRKIYFQRDIFDSLGEILRKEGIKKVLVVTDEHIFSLFGERLNRSLQGLEFEVFKEVLPEPELNYIEKSAQKFEKKGYDAIVAFGGGSVIDFAKSLAIKVSDPGMQLKNVNPFEPLNLRIKLIAIPTTSGTGSDVSFGIVLSNEKTKLALGNYELVPTIDILDSSLTPTDKRITVATGIDAFVHSFEAIASNNSSIFTDALAERAIETIYHNMPKAIDNDESSKDLMHLSATLAGIAFSNSGTAIAHALGHSFGSTFHATHGTSVGLFLIPSIIFNSQDNQTREKYIRVARIIDADGVEGLIESIRAFYSMVGQPHRVSELGIDREQYMSKIEELVTKAMQDSEIAFNPVIAGEEDLRKIFIENF